MKRYIKDGVTAANAQVFSGFIDFRTKTKQILSKKNAFVYPSQDIIVVPEGTILSIYNNEWKTFVVDQETELNATHLDEGVTFAVGKDYCVYFVDDGGEGKFVISLNSTYPIGQNVHNTRKIGGFHYGHIRKTTPRYVPVNDSLQMFGPGWKNAVTIGIVPNSVWDLQNRPKCNPAGMVKISDTVWESLYIPSLAEAISFQDAVNAKHVAGGLLQSTYGSVPVTGTEGCCQHNFVELAQRSGCRLGTYGEWCIGAYGNPEGEDGANNYGWTKTTNTSRVRTGCNVDDASGSYIQGGGIKPYAISARNVVDCVGNVWEWLDEIVGAKGDGWITKPIADMGNYYGTPIALIAGGDWNVGVRCGARAAGLSDAPWYVGTSIGCRLFCDSL